MEIMAHEFEQPLRNEVGDGANSMIDEASKVDRICEILFGSQMRDYDERFCHRTAERKFDPLKHELGRRDRSWPRAAGERN